MPGGVRKDQVTLAFIVIARVSQALARDAIRGNERQRQLSRIDVAARRDGHFQEQGGLLCW